MNIYIPTFFCCTRHEREAPCGKFRAASGSSRKESGKQTYYISTDRWRDRQTDRPTGRQRCSIIKAQQTQWRVPVRFAFHLKNFFSSSCCFLMSSFCLSV